jgi:hypothetical protein
MATVVHIMSGQKEVLLLSSNTADGNLGIALFGTVIADSMLSNIAATEEVSRLNDRIGIQVIAQENCQAK